MTKTIIYLNTKLIIIISKMKLLKKLLYLKETLNLNIINLLLHEMREEVYKTVSAFQHLNVINN